MRANDGPERTDYVWGDAAVNYAFQSRLRVRVFARKAGGVIGGRLLRVYSQNLAGDGGVLDFFLSIDGELVKKVVVVAR